MAEFAGGTPAQKHRIEQRSPNGSFSADRTMIQREFEFDQNSECSRVEEVASLQELSAPPIQQLAEYATVKKVSVVYESSLESRPHICGTDDAKQFFQRYWQRCPGNDQERFVVACLDTKNRVQSVVVVTIGTLDASLVHPREVFKPAIIEGSSSVILSHNHPSGNTTPSREDFQVTDRLTKAGELLGITVLDHIIHGDGTSDVFSIRERQ